MVFDSVAGDGFTAGFIDQVCHYRMEILFPGLLDAGIAEFYRKDGLDVQLLIGVRQYFDVLI